MDLLTCKTRNAVPYQLCMQCTNRSFKRRTGEIASVSNGPAINKRRTEKDEKETHRKRKLKKEAEIKRNMKKE